MLHIRDADMLDGTPVLDLKPYVAYTDAYPQAGPGWLEDAARTRRGLCNRLTRCGAYAVVLEARAAEQAAWIQSRTGLAIAERIRATLTLGPAPHPYRRIRRLAAGLQLSVKEWRVRFSVIERAVRVTGIESGFRASQLAQVLMNLCSRTASSSRSGHPSVWGLTRVRSDRCVGSMTHRNLDRDRE